MLVNKMFFEMFLNYAVRNRFPSSTHAFWMDPDATPVLPHWIDALVGLAARSIRFVHYITFEVLMELNEWK
jgi:hypothetical protein